MAFPDSLNYGSHFIVSTLETLVSDAEDVGGIQTNKLAPLGG